jgi:hypothetical protein
MDDTVIHEPFTVLQWEKEEPLTTPMSVVLHAMPVSDEMPVD